MTGHGPWRRFGRDGAALALALALVVAPTQRAGAQDAGSDGVSAQEPIGPEIRAGSRVVPVERAPLPDDVPLDDAATDLGEGAVEDRASDPHDETGERLAVEDGDEGADGEEGADEGRPTSERRYTEWEGHADGDVDPLLEELEEMVEAATRDRAAAPDFLDDLRALIPRYRGRPSDRQAVEQDAPPPVRALVDRFDDGRLQDPVDWRVLAGRWRVDDRLGLHVDARGRLDADGGDLLDRDTIAPPDPTLALPPPIRPIEEEGARDPLGGGQMADLARRLFDTALRTRLEALGGPADRATRRLPPVLRPTVPRDAVVAALAADVRLRNDFALETAIWDSAQAGALEFRMVRHGPRDPLADGGDEERDPERIRGYRLVYQADAEPRLGLYVVDDDGPRVLASLRGVNPLRRARIHRLSWTRDRDGLMVVEVNGATVLETEDIRFREPWDGVVLMVAGGDYAIRRLAINEDRDDDTN